MTEKEEEDSLVICRSRLWHSFSSRVKRRWNIPREMCSPGRQTYVYMCINFYYHNYQYFAYLCKRDVKKGFTYYIIV